MKINELVDVRKISKKVKDEYRHYSIGLTGAEIEQSFADGLSCADGMIRFKMEQFEFEKTEFCSPFSAFACAANYNFPIIKNEVEMLIKSVSLIEKQMYGWYGKQRIGKPIQMHICAALVAYSIIDQLDDLEYEETDRGIYYSVSVIENEYEVNEVNEEVFA